jgi:hypothetical protein
LDRIDLSEIDANTRVGGNQAFVLVADFTGASGQLTTRAVDGDMRILGDVNGDRTADFAIDLAIFSEMLTTADLIL